MGHDRRHPATVAVVLAAGAGSRFSGAGHKLAADLDGRTVLSHAVAAAVGADIGPVIVVTGAVAEPDLGDLAARITIVHNPHWTDGQSSSLQTAVAAARRLDATAIVVGLGDQPGVTPESWRSVAAALSPIAVAVYGDQRRNPVRLAAEVWPLLPHTGDIGARELIRVHPELVEQVPCSGSPRDIDTLEDLEQWQNRSSTSSP
jgi:CTP:molybdopterin cytidylyltransferase MocA